MECVCVCMSVCVCMLKAVVDWVVLVREWLECMTAGRYQTHDADFETLSLPEEHIAALLDPDSRSSAIGVMGRVPSFASVAVLPIEIRSCGSTG